MITVIQSKRDFAAVNNNDCSLTPQFTIGSDRFMALRRGKVMKHRLNSLTNRISPSIQAIKARPHTPL